MWHYGIYIHSPLTSVGVVHSTWPSRTMWHMHAPTFNKWQKKKKKTLHILTHGAMRGCGLTSLVVCINDKICDIRERNVTIRSEIWTTNIRSLGFQDIREWVIIWRLILQSLGCTSLDLAENLLSDWLIMGTYNQVKYTYIWSKLDIDPAFQGRCLQGWAIVEVGLSFTHTLGT